VFSARQDLKFFSIVIHYVVCLKDRSTDFSKSSSPRSRISCFFFKFQFFFLFLNFMQYMLVFSSYFSLLFFTIFPLVMCFRRRFIRKMCLIDSGLPLFYRMVGILLCEFM